VALVLNFPHRILNRSNPGHARTRRANRAEGAKAADEVRDAKAFDAIAEPSDQINTTLLKARFISSRCDAHRRLTEPFFRSTHQIARRTVGWRRFAGALHRDHTIHGQAFVRFAADQHPLHSRRRGLDCTSRGTPCVCHASTAALPRVPSPASSLTARLHAPTRMIADQIVVAPRIRINVALHMHTSSACSRSTQRPPSSGPSSRPNLQVRMSNGTSAARRSGFLPLRVNTPASSRMSCVIRRNSRATLHSSIKSSVWPANWRHHQRCQNPNAPPSYDSPQILISCI